MTPQEKDARLISLDFISEIGELLIAFGAAVSASAASENIQLLELSLRKAHLVLMDGIDELQHISINEGCDDR